MDPEKLKGRELDEFCQDRKKDRNWTLSRVRPPYGPAQQDDDFRSNITALLELGPAEE